MLLSILFAIVLMSCLALTARRRNASALAPICAAIALYLLVSVIAKVILEGFAPEEGTLAVAGGIIVHGIVAVVVFLLASRWIRGTGMVTGMSHKSKG